MSELGAALFCLILGFIFDAIVQTVAANRRGAVVKVAGMVFANNALWFSVVVLTYLVEGFVVHGELGEGWLDWTTIMQNMAAAYAPVTLLSIGRLLFGD